MNLNVLNVTLFLVGIVLMYSAVKNKDPRDVVLEALGQKRTATSKLEPNPNKGTTGFGPAGVWA